jgi:hypothetical protein
MTILVYLRMDEWQRSSQNRSGEIFATSGVFIRGFPLNKNATHRQGRCPEEASPPPAHNLEVSSRLCASAARSREVPSRIMRDKTRQRQDTEVFNVVDRHK